MGDYHEMKDVPSIEGEDDLATAKKGPDLGDIDMSELNTGEGGLS
jgi:hypothetical protein